MVCYHAAGSNEVGMSESLSIHCSCIYLEPWLLYLLTHQHGPTVSFPCLLHRLLPTPPPPSLSHASSTVSFPHLLHRLLPTPPPPSLSHASSTVSFPRLLHRLFPSSFDRLQYAQMERGKPGRFHQVNEVNFCLGREGILTERMLFVHTFFVLNNEC